jgi:acyl carrier protein phosphodiesterase
MNFLAHAYLSFDHPDILVGNMISDFIKGKKKFDYPELIQKGIALHRAIDNFTDTHEATKEAKVFFRQTYRLYAGAFVDVVYDHFLANDENEFAADSLYVFSQEVYSTLDDYQSFLPEKFARMFPYMKEHNWLFNYREKWGTGKSLEGVVRRALYLQESASAFRIFEENYQPLKECYRQFWADLKPFAKNQFQILLSAA